MPRAITGTRDAVWFLVHSRSASAKALLEGSIEQDLFHISSFELGSSKTSYFLPMLSPFRGNAL